jgi:hypothetical protein
MSGSIQVSDLYFAAYLRVAGIPLVKDPEGNPVTLRDGTRVIFQFEPMDKVTYRDMKSQFYSDYAKVPALSYAQAVKYMKNLVFSGRR